MKRCLLLKLMEPSGSQEGQANADKRGSCRKKAFALAQIRDRTICPNVFVSLYIFSTVYPEFGCLLREVLLMSEPEYKGKSYPIMLVKRRPFLNKLMQNTLMWIFIKREQSLLWNFGFSAAQMIRRSTGG